MIKTLIQISFIIFSVSLYGCGFKPIYKISDENISIQDYSVEVINNPSREILQEINESLISNIDSNHRVLIKVEENMTPLIINTNGTISKYRIEIVIDYSLLEIDADKISNLYFFYYVPWSEIKMSLGAWNRSSASSY